METVETPEPEIVGRIAGREDESRIEVVFSLVYDDDGEVTVMCSGERILTFSSMASKDRRRLVIYRHTDVTDDGCFELNCDGCVATDDESEL